MSVRDAGEKGRGNMQDVRTTLHRALVLVLVGAAWGGGGPRTGLAADAAPVLGSVDVTIVTGGVPGVMWWLAGATVVAVAGGILIWYARLRREIRQRRHNEGTLRESATRFRALVELSPDAILVHRRGTLLYGNPAAARLLGVENPATLSWRDLLSFVHPDDRRTLRDAVHETAGLQAGALPSGTRPIRLRRHDGHIVPVDWLLARTVFEGGAAIQSVVRDVSERRRLEANLRHMAATDFLTEVYNRRALFEAARREVRRSARHGHPLALLVVDVDRFKRINDTLGHAAGDTALCHLVALCRESLRGEDVLGRLGGEEFCILLPETDSVGALEVAERLRVRVAASRLQVEGGTIAMTVSIGMAALQPGETTWESLLKRADQAVYRAKAAGRDRVFGADVPDGSAFINENPETGNRTVVLSVRNGALPEKPAGRQASGS